MNHPVIRDMSCQGFVVAAAHMLRPVCVLFVASRTRLLRSCWKSCRRCRMWGESEWISDVWVLLFQKWDANVYNKELRALVFCPKKLGGGFKYFLFSPLFGEDSHVD